MSSAPIFALVPHGVLALTAVPRLAPWMEATSKDGDPAAREHAVRVRCAVNAEQAARGEAQEVLHTSAGCGALTADGHRAADLAGALALYLRESIPGAPWYAFGTLDLHARVDTSPGLLVALSRLSETVTKGNGPRPRVLLPVAARALVARYPIDLGLRIAYVSSLSEAIDTVRANVQPGFAHPAVMADPYREPEFALPYRGRALRALMVAAATRSHVEVNRAPWGTSLYGRTVAALRPWLTVEEAAEVMRAHDLAGLLTTDGAPRREPYAPPFRAPHHTASRAGLVGARGRPGELALAHHGILFAESAELRPETREAIEHAANTGRVTAGDRLYELGAYPTALQVVSTRPARPEACSAERYSARRLHLDATLHLDGSAPSEGESVSWQTARAIVAAVSRELRREGHTLPTRGAQARAFELVSARLPAGPMTAEEIAAEAREDFDAARVALD